MSDLSKALKEYIKANDHPKLAAFVIDNKQTVKEWLMYFETLTDATNSLKRKMQAMYKEVHPKKKEQPTVNVDISVLFAEAKSNGTATVVGNKIVEEATKTAGQHLTQTLKERRLASSSELSSLDVSPTLDASESSSSLSDSLASPVLIDGFNITESFERFKSLAVLKSKKKGFKMHQDIHEVMALSHILLLNENQHGRALIDHIGLGNLDKYLGQLKQSYLDQSTVDDDLFNNILKIIRGCKNRPRNDVKVDLMKLAINADDVLDSSIIDVLLNCVQKLSDTPSNASIGEQQLITNVIDPIISPLFHHPEDGREFYWLNRTVEHTDERRPDGGMFIKEQRHTKYAAGYCEVKSMDNEDNVHDVHLDLHRLSKFCKSALDCGYVKAMIAVHVVGNTIFFYLFTLESEGFYVMFELGHMDAPSTYPELTHLAMNMDLLKQISITYRKHCVRRSEDDLITSRKRPSLDEKLLNEILNPGKPTKKKTKTALQFY